MNIVLYVNSYLPTVGGREIVVHYLAKAYKRLGHNVRVLGPSGWWRNRKITFSYPVHRWPSLRGAFQENVWRMHFWLDTKIWGADVIHAHCAYPSAYIAAKSSVCHHTPLVITPHGYDINIIPEMNYGQRLDPVIGPKIAYAYRKADQMTAISENIRDAILSAGVPAEKINLIPNGIDVDRFKGEPTADVYRWLDLPPSSRIILTVGNYRPIKGHNVIVNAMTQILKLCPQAKLVIVGRDTEKVAPFVQENALKDHVRIVGSIQPPYSAKKNEATSVDWLAEIYKEASIYVSAGIAEGAEGLSLAMLDAMAAGLPIVATRISGNNDVIHNGDTGLLVTPNNPDMLAKAILRFLQSVPLCDRLAGNAAEFAQQLSWANVAEMYIRLYKRLIAK